MDGDSEEANNLRHPPRLVKFHSDCVQWHSEPAQTRNNAHLVSPFRAADARTIPMSEECCHCSPPPVARGGLMALTAPGPFPAPPQPRLTPRQPTGKPSRACSGVPTSQRRARAAVSGSETHLGRCTNQGEGSLASKACVGVVLTFDFNFNASPLRPENPSSGTLTGVQSVFLCIFTSHNVAACHQPISTSPDPPSCNHERSGALPISGGCPTLGR